jgi:hypothetical protein
MHNPFLKYVPILLVSAFLVTSACGESSPPSPTAPSPEAVVVKAQPLAIAPDLLPTPSCTTLPPFRGRLVVIVLGGRDFIVRRLGFAFSDRFGGSAAPTVIPILPTPLGSSTFPNSSPVPLPGSTTLPSPPVPIPGVLPLESLVTPRDTSREFPVLLEFGCGVPAAGTLVVSVDTTDGQGRLETSRVKVRIGE